jgi:hypothetical protein
MSRVLHGFVFAFGLAILAAACSGEDLSSGGFPDAAGSNACGPSTCDGCCTQEGACITNIWDRQCGAGGQLCTDCTANGRGCNESGQCQVPPACDASNCPNGCCVGDECVAPGDSDDACGSGGIQCQICDAERGHQCDGAQCRPPCGPDTCTGCCVDGFTCRDDPNERACGGGGEPCEDCGEDGLCTSAGQCVDASCANSCSGCCTTDGDCIDDVENTQCGFNGALCKDCTDDNEICASPGVCLSAECSASCQGGCCDEENECRNGNSVQACGSGGNACFRCGPNSICVDGECRLDPASRWDVVIVNAEVPERDQNGNAWDPFGGLPDPYVVMTAGLGTSDERTDRTPHVNNTTFADFDNHVVLEDVRADLLTGAGRVLFVWMDRDCCSSDDQMSLEKPVRVPEEFFDGTLIRYTQVDEYEGAVNSPLTLIVRFRLLPSGEGANAAYDPSTHTIEGEPMCLPEAGHVLTAVNALQ